MTWEWVILLLGLYISTMVLLLGAGLINTRQKKRREDASSKE